MEANIQGFVTSTEGHDVRNSLTSTFTRGTHMATSTNDGFQIAGIGVGGLLVIAGLALIFLTGSNFLGFVLLLVGLIGFGGFAKGKWY